MATVANVGHRLTMSLIVVPDTLGDIRRTVVRQLDHWGFSAITEDAVLVVVELLTNVYKHADGVCDLLMEPSPDHLTIQVSDTVTTPPTMRQISGSAEEGRGLQLINELTEHWETAITRTGKVISCTLRTGDRPVGGRLCRSRRSDRESTYALHGSAPGGDDGAV